MSEESKKADAVAPATAALPPGASIRELAREARWQQIPEGFRFAGTSLKGHRGLCRGRDDVLKEIGSYVEQYWRSARIGKAGSGLSKYFGATCVITSAPGAGKSTLLTEFAIRCGSHGIACPLVGPEHCLNATSLAEQLRAGASTIVEDQTDPITSGIQRLMRSEGAPTAKDESNGSLGVPATGIAAKAGLAKLQEITAAIRHAFTEQAPLTVADVWQELNRATDGNFIVRVDECHSWLNDDVDRAALRGNLRSLVDPELRDAYDIRGGGLLLAGLGSVITIMDDLGLKRARTFWLDALAPEKAEDVIRYSILTSTASDERKQRVAWPWAAALAHDFGSWVHHTAAAGESASVVLQAIGDDTSFGRYSAVREALALEWARTCAARLVQELYQDRIKAARKVAGPYGAPVLVALADRTDNEMGVNLVKKVIRTALVNDESYSQVTDELVDRAYHGLIGCGLLQETNRGETGDDQSEVFQIAMPSLRRFVRERETETNAEGWANAQTLVEDALAAATLRRPDRPPNSNGDDGEGSG